MRRRRALRLIVSGAVVAGGVVAAVSLLHRVRWTRRPRITVISAAGDSRVPIVHEAIEHWNRTLADLGTPFRLGEVTVVEGSVPDADVRALGPTWRPTLPASMARYPGELLVVLSVARFISCTALRGRRVVVAIQNHDRAPLTLPNVLRNVIAHELGHAIGLDHNADPTLLMCGRPASCRPGIYESQTARFFPLSADEETRLLALYPAEWTER